MKAILFVAAGSGLGGVLRYGVHLLVHRIYPSTFPLANLIINVTGSFLIGFFFALAEKGNLPGTETRLFLMTGLCGGFTTFSAFSMDNISLLRSGEWLLISLYITGSVALGLLATYAGIYVVK
ncbi:MAG: CrcB family protein [Chitinophagaceae bacterium]